jgi:hypothetical protein
MGERSVGTLERGRQRSETLEGSRLGPRAMTRLIISIICAAETYSKRRLPGTTQRDLLHSASVGELSSRTYRETKRWVVRVSRPAFTFSGLTLATTKNRVLTRASVEAAPLRGVDRYRPRKRGSAPRVPTAICVNLRSSAVEVFLSRPFAVFLLLLIFGQVGEPIVG